MRAGDGDAEADVEVMPLVGAVEVFGGDEVFARGHQISADVRLVPDVLMTDQLLQPVPALAQEVRVLAAVLHHPFDEGFARRARRRDAPVVCRRNAGRRRGAERGAGGPDEKMTPVHRGALLTRRMGKQSRHAVKRRGVHVWQRLFVFSGLSVKKCRVGNRPAARPDAIIYISVMTIMFKIPVALAAAGWHA